MEGKYCVEVPVDTEHVIKLLEEKIYLHNSMRIDEHDGLLFSRIIRDEGRQIVAGIAGWTWAGVCEITQLWVSEKFRKGGIGKQLLEAAEEGARIKGCSTILVKTYSFQAPHFYERHGYKIKHVINGFPEGHYYYTLTKRIA